MAAENVGIQAIELYFPKLFVDQKELEIVDDCVGKYTIGLGQYKMSVAAENEDVNSILLTVTQRLLNRFQIKPEQIGYLEVGSETVIDKSKSSKTVLMQLFQNNEDLPGVDCRNACYGLTSALFNVINWMESSSWDGRLGLVVGGDIAVYGSKEARPTGGCGSVAILVGPNATIVLDQKVRSFHMEHVYDFYKGDLKSEYPQVDGRLSLECYTRALDKCYLRFKDKCNQAGIYNKTAGECLLNDGIDYCLFHAPFARQVEKAFCRLVYLESLDENITTSKSNPLLNDAFQALQSFKDSNIDESRCNVQLQRASLAACANLLTNKVEPTLLLARNVGNMYTASLYGGLVSLLVSKSPSELIGKRLLCYSYGSGLTSSIFSMRFSNDENKISSLANSLNYILPNLNSRMAISPQQFLDILTRRQATYSIAPHTPTFNKSEIFPDVVTLESIDDRFRRVYCFPSSLS